MPSYPVADILTTRKTTKVMFDPERPAAPETDRETIESLIALAGWAPFHKPAHRVHWRGTRTIEPWRFHLADAGTCRRLIGFVQDNAEKAGRVPQMLAAAEALILATWLPNPPENGDDGLNGGLFEPTMANMEHIAAASAAVQSFLLAATERGLTTYWSSGGYLRDTATFDLLGIPAQQILLGAVFVFPNDGGERIPGGMRDKRSERAAWSNWVTPRE
ncbi:MAG: nitroreductase family protein [Rhodospirillaceae bacterium]|nr:nitroreductase family protein [Rhodospirillaceae bacterium]MDE0619835.1 nitroreductase family protein [Rhodospirillaceae bacterium]